MGIGIGEALLIALIAAAFLKPDELSRLAKTVGRWMGEAQRMSRGFMEELRRETNFDEVEKSARELKREFDEAVKDPAKLEAPPGQVARGPESRREAGPPPDKPAAPVENEPPAPEPESRN